MTAEEMRRRGARYARSGERIYGPHMVQLPDGRRVMNPAGTLGNALPVGPPAPAVPVEAQRSAFRAPDGLNPQWAEVAVDYLGNPLPVLRGAPGPAPRASTPAVVDSGMRYDPAWMRPMGGPVSVATEVPPPAVPDGFMRPGAGNLLMTEGMGNLPPSRGVAERPPAAGMEPRIFTDSDGIARASFGMGQEGLDRGLVRADRSGVPEGMVMAPVRGLSQGEAMVGRSLSGPLPPAPVVLAPEAPPATPEAYARAVNAVGGFKAPPMTEAEAGIQRDLAMTRPARWNQSGSTTRANRRADELRNQSAAMQALTRKTDEQIRLAQGTPVVGGAAGSGVMGWNPQTQKFDMVLPPAEQVKQVPLEDRIKNVAAAIKAVSGADVNPNALMQVQTTTDPALRKQLLEALTKGNPEVTRWLTDYMKTLLPEFAVQGAGGAAPAGGGTGGAAPAGGGTGAGGATRKRDEFDDFSRKG